MKKKYITTSISYLNAEPHIGHLLELVSADILNRHWIQNGEKTFFLTGTDDHGLKVAQAAEKAGQTEKEYTDKISQKFRDLGKNFNLGFDYFIRTTQKEHAEYVGQVWVKLKEKNLLEKRNYQAKYCSGCEAFKTESELENNKCLIHQKEVELVSEENWFFKLKKFQKPLLEWYRTKPIQPEHKVKEILNFVENGLEDISVSRPVDKVSWGIPVPDDKSQVIYVWIEALLNYLSVSVAAKIKPEDIWPADIQVIGKDILKFHAIYWPALLLALGLELPKKILVHGFINSDGTKMSKSLGNVITPSQLLERYGRDATRYLLFRQLSFYDDSNLVWEDFDSLYDGELANGLGNLVSRVVGLLSRLNEKVEIKPCLEKVQREFESQKEKLLKDHLLNKAEFAGELHLINQLQNQADQWITSHKPWQWVNEKVSSEQITDLIIQTNLIEIAWRLEPFTPEIAEDIVHALDKLEVQPLFPRLG